MTAQIKPLAAKVVINTSGNKSTVGNADTNAASNGAAFHFKTIGQKTDYHTDLSV